MDSAHLSQLLLPVALFLIMFGIGLSLTPADFQRLTQQPKPVVLGVALQLVGLPAFGFLVICVFSLPPVYAVGIAILTFAPGGATSNMISYLCRADTALSVSLTALASVVTPLSLPLMSYVAVGYFMELSVEVNVPILQTITKLIVISLLPVALGMWLRHYKVAIAMRLQPVIKWASVLFMLTVVIGLLVANRDQLWELSSVAIPAVLTLSVGAMALGALTARIARLPWEQALTLGIETGIQNAGLALVITGTVLQDQAMSTVVLMYGILMQVPAILLVLYRNLPAVKWRWVVPPS